MNEIRTQYLLIFEKGSICRETKNILNLFQANSDIHISDNKLVYDSTEFKLDIIKKIEDESSQYFQLDIISYSEESIEKHSNLLREIRKLTINNKGQVEILLDEISFYYSQKAYPLLYKIENLMRKLITLFLIDGVGLKKTKMAIPIEIESKQSNNLLNQTDFIHLGEILTKEYSIKQNTELYKLIQKANKNEDLDLDELKSFIPKSNLERYFKKYIDFDSDYLKKKWNRLYELRCLVAHNNFFTKNEYNELVDLISEVNSKLKAAILKIEKLSVPENEKDSVLEFTASNSNHLLGNFIEEWKNLEQKLIDFSEIKESKNVFFCVKSILNDGYLTNDLYNDILKLIHFRNKAIHSVAYSFTDEEILIYIGKVKRINSQIAMKSEYGEDWPFTVSKGVIYNDKNAVYFRYRNLEYGLNGMAMHRDFKKLEDIWLKDPKIPQLKVSIGPFIDIGLRINNNP